MGRLTTWLLFGEESTLLGQVHTTERITTSFLPFPPVKRGYFLGKHSRRSRRVGKRVSPPDTGAISGCSYRRTSISYVWRPINCAHSGELSKCVKSFVYYINSEVLNLHSLLAQQLYAYITVFLIPPKHYK